LKELYEKMHSEGCYDGHSMFRDDTRALLGLVAGTRSRTLLDFGGGKGYQYSKDHLNRNFGIEDTKVTIYDIGVPEFSTLPLGRFDGVVSTDVLEHIPEEELPGVLDTIFSKATKFVYIAVFCGPALQVLPDGSNAHCTIKEPGWWNKLIKAHNVKKIPLVISYRHPTGL